MYKDGNLLNKTKWFPNADKKTNFCFPDMTLVTKQKIISLLDYFFLYFDVRAHTTIILTTNFNQLYFNQIINVVQ